MVKANQGEKVTKKPLSPPKTDGVQFQASDGFYLYKKTDIIFIFLNISGVFLYRWDFSYYQRFHYHLKVYEVS